MVGSRDQSLRSEQLTNCTANSKYHNYHSAD